MDPLNRVPPFDRALPDVPSSVGSSRRGTPDPGAAEERAADEIPIDELTREFELDLEGDLIDDDSVDGSRRPAPTDHPGVSEDDYATVGVRNLEWRLPIIRSAAHRSADAIASNQLIEPSDTHEDQLTKILLATYRLIDPRFRGSYFQQVRVGRTLPMVLQTASRVDGTPLSLQPTIASDPTQSVRLFGHSIPVTASPSARAVHRRIGRDGAMSARSFRQPSTQPIRKRRVAASTHFRTEAVEVLAELQSRSHPAEWTLWFQGTRLIAMLITVACVVVAIIAAYRTALPLRELDTPPAAVAQHRHNNTLPQQLPPAVSPPTARPPLPSPPVMQTAAAPTTSPETYLLAAPETDSGPPERVALEADRTPTVIDSRTKQPELTSEQLMEALARVAGTSDVAPLGMNIPVNTTPGLPVKPTSAGNPPIADSLPTVPTPATSTDSPIDEPKTSWTESSASLDEAAIASAVIMLWSETKSATGKFTGASVADLIDHWDLIADLATKGSAENLAAERLVRQASWLIHPLAKIVAQLRSTDPLIASKFLEANESELQNTSNLSAEEVQELLGSWQAARTRVTRTSDLNQMLDQANVLLDRIIISDQLSPYERSNFLASFLIDVEKLARISSDQDATAETENLLAAMDTLPTASEWARLAAAVPPSGMIASIYCLQQRRWDQGIPGLGQASNPAVAAVANSEWSLIESEQLDAATPSSDVLARAALAKRWSKIADRLDPREAAAVRLHAIDLYGVEPETQAQRNILKSQLPKYVQ